MIPLLLVLGTRLVGAIIVFAGLIKTVSPYGFKTHLHSLRIIPPEFLRPAVVGAAGIEVAWGVALILGVKPSIVLPMSVVALLALSIVSWRGVDAGKTSDCGCYGGFLRLSIAQSLSLNALFIAVLSAAWATKSNPALGETWPALTSGIFGIAAGWFAFFADVHEARKGEPLIDLSPLKVGKQWNDAWAGNGTANLTGEFYVSFLGMTCPCCKSWIRFANAMSQSDALPPVIGVVAATEPQIKAFADEHRVAFQLSRISASLMARMTRRVPATVVVRDRQIVEVFYGLMPAEHSVRFAAAFFPNSKPAAELQEMLRTA